MFQTETVRLSLGFERIPIENLLKQHDTKRFLNEHSNTHLKQEHTVHIPKPALLTLFAYSPKVQKRKIVTRVP